MQGTRRCARGIGKGREKQTEVALHTELGEGPNQLSPSTNTRGAMADRQFLDRTLFSLPLSRRNEGHRISTASHWLFVRNQAQSCITRSGRAARNERASGVVWKCCLAVKGYTLQQTTLQSTRSGLPASYRGKQSAAEGNRHGTTCNLT